MMDKPSLIIAAGKGCFTYCRGCYQYFGKTQVPTDDLLRFIKEYKSAFNLTKITLAGGDPMTRKDIVYLVNELKNLNLKISMDTVGKNFVKNSNIVFQDFGEATYIDPLIFKNKIEKIGIPLDGYTTEQINYFRKNITLKEIIDILTALDKNNYNICINTVVNKMNVYELEQIANIIKPFYNIKQWQLFQYSPIGELGFKNRLLFEIDDFLFKQKVTELISRVRNSKIQIEGKSNVYRNGKYILVNSDGEVWQPNYNIIKLNIQNMNSNVDKNIIGTIYDIDIINRIRLNLKKNSQTIRCTSQQVLKS